MRPVDQDGWAESKRFVDAGGIRTAYVEIDGDGPALLLIHGFSDSSRSYSRIAPYLADRKLIIPDLRGHGATQSGSGSFSLHSFAGDVAAMIDALALDRPVLVGHSLGAMIAVRTAASFPQGIGGLVLLAGSLRPDIADDHPMVTGVNGLRDPISPGDPFFAYWHDCRPDIPRTFLDRVAEEASLLPAERWRAILAEIRDADLTGCAADVLGLSPMIVCGRDDPLFGEQDRMIMEQAFSRAPTLTLDHCGHNVHWEEPARVAAAILSRFPARPGAVSGVSS